MVLGILTSLLGLGGKLVSPAINYANRRKDGTQQSTSLRTSRFCLNIFHWSAGVVHALTTAVVLAVVLTYSQA